MYRGPTMWFNTVLLSDIHTRKHPLKRSTGAMEQSYGILEVRADISAMNFNIQTYIILHAYLPTSIANCQTPSLPLTPLAGPYGEADPSVDQQEDHRVLCGKVIRGADPASLLSDVAMVLDKEAEVFVVKMWRLLIYEGSPGLGPSLSLLLFLSLFVFVQI